MEENNNENVKVKRNNNTGIIVILVIIILALGVCIGYLLSKNFNGEKTTIVANNMQIKEENEATNKATKQDKDSTDVEIEYKKVEYSDDIKILDKFLINNKNIMDSITGPYNIEHKLENYSLKDNMVFLSVQEATTQFMQRGLYIFDINGVLIQSFLSLKEADYGNMSYEYCGKFSYNDSENTLNFKAFCSFRHGDSVDGDPYYNNKPFEELSNSELEEYKNSANEIEYTYKYENGKFTLVKKEAVSLIKDINS